MDIIRPKLINFEMLCGDWDFRNIDMTKPHLQSIDIKDNNIFINCELFEPDIEDYISCSAGIINDKKLIKQFYELNLRNKYKVLNFISTIESYVDWDKVNEELENEITNRKNELYNNNYVNKKIVLAKQLGEGWNWHKYNDGSGHLESPNGDEYMLYDLQTNEYKETENSNYDFFPLSNYYADGIEPSKFDPFEYMENEMIKYLSKEKEELNI